MTATAAIASSDMAPVVPTLQKGIFQLVEQDVADTGVQFRPADPVVTTSFPVKSGVPANPQVSPVVTSHLPTEGLSPSSEPVRSIEVGPWMPHTETLAATGLQPSRTADKWTSTEEPEAGATASSIGSTAAINLQQEPPTRGLGQLTPILTYIGRVSPGCVTFTWDMPPPDKTDISEYELFVSRGEQASQFASFGYTTEKSITLYDLIEGEPYHFAVSAVFDGLGSGPISKSLFVIP